MDNRNERRSIKPVEFEEVQTIQPEQPVEEAPRSRRIGAPAPEIKEEPAPAKIRNIGELRLRRRPAEQQPAQTDGRTQRIRPVRRAAEQPAQSEGRTQRIRPVTKTKQVQEKSEKGFRLPGLSSLKKKQTQGEQSGGTKRIRAYREEPQEEITAKGIMKDMGLRILKGVGAAAIALVLMVLLGFKVYDFAYERFVKPVGDDPTEIVEVVIDKKDSLSTISKKLEAAGVIRNSTIFKYYVDFSDMSTKLLAGKFELSPSMTYDEVINVLKRPAAAQTSTRVMLVEGILNEQIVTKLEDASVFEDATDFDTQIARGSEYNEYWFVQEVLDKQAGSSKKREYILEGYLFPDTYDFFIASDEESVIEKMLNRFNEIFTEEYRARAAELGMTTDEVVTLASIIQKEAGKLEDFKKVSAVFHNRLESGMKLQSCATLQYFMPEKKFVYSAAETQTPSPYNTYLHTGLPVGPICNPGKDAIEAALWPDEQFMNDGYLYFCAGDPAEGTTVFAKTLDEHNANVAKYQHLW